MLKSVGGKSEVGRVPQTSAFWGMLLMPCSAERRSGETAAVHCRGSVTAFMRAIRCRRFPCDQIHPMRILGLPLTEHLYPQASQRLRCSQLHWRSNHILSPRR